MKKTIFTSTLIILLYLSAIADENWNIFYWNNQINPSINVQSEIAVAPDGTLYLAELDYTDIYETGLTYVHVRSYDISQWTADNFSQSGWETVGQLMHLNMPNNEVHIDFAITPDNQLYIGMQDSIFWFNASANLWESYYVPDYIGGMMVDESGRLLILQSVDISSDHRFLITEFEAGSLTTVATIEYDFPAGVILYPRIMNEANRIFQVDGTFYVSIARASTHQNYYFKGDANEGFTALKEHFNHLNLSSMVVSTQGEIIISHRGASSPYTLALKSYDFDLDDWVAFDMDGLNAGAAHANHLAYDRQGRLTFTYSGEFNTGFVFRYGDNGWEHIGPGDAIGIAHMPKLAFDLSNSLFLMHGIGAGATPLVVRRFVDETTSVADFKHNFSLQLYPNPAKSHFTMDLSNSPMELNAAIMSLFDNKGQFIRQWHYLQPKTTIDVADLPKGLYSVVVQDGQYKHTQNIIVQ